MDNAETQWLAQLGAMRAALADLKLPQKDESTTMYGEGVWTDEEDFSEPTSGDDIWDLIGEEEDESSSDALDGLEDDFAAHNIDEDATTGNWLRNKLTGIASHGSGMNVDDLEQHVVAILGSDSSGTIPRLRISRNAANQTQTTSCKCFSQIL